MTDWTQEAIEQRLQARIANPSPPRDDAVEMHEPHPRAVVVTDIHMSFVSMVGFANLRD